MNTRKMQVQALKTGIVLGIAMILTGMATAAIGPDTTPLTENCGSNQYLGGDGNCYSDSDTTHHDDPGDHAASSDIDVNGNKIVDTSILTTNVSSVPEDNQISHRLWTQADQTRGYLGVKTKGGYRTGSSHTYFTTDRSYESNYFLRGDHNRNVDIGGDLTVPNGNLTLSGSGANGAIDLSGDLFTNGGDIEAGNNYLDMNAGGNVRIAVDQENDGTQYFEVKGNGDAVSGTLLFQVEDTGQVSIPNGNLDMSGNNVLNGAVCPDGTCDKNNYETFDTAGLGTSNIYAGSGGEVDFQDAVMLNGNLLDGVKNIRDQGRDRRLQLSDNGNLHFYNSTGRVVASIKDGAPGYLDMRDNNINDAQSVYTNNLYDADGGSQIEVRDRLGMNGNDIYGEGNFDVHGISELNSDGSNLHLQHVPSNSRIEIGADAGTVTTDFNGQNIVNLGTLNSGGSTTTVGGTLNMGGNRIDNVNQLNVSATEAWGVVLESGDLAPQKGLLINSDGDVNQNDIPLEIRANSDATSVGVSDTIFMIDGSTGNVGIGEFNGSGSGNAPDAALDVKAGNLDMNGNNIDIGAAGQTSGDPGVNNTGYVNFANEETSYVPAQEFTLMADNSDGLLYYHNGAWRRLFSEWHPPQHSELGGVSYNDHHGVGTGVKWDTSNNVAFDCSQVNGNQLGCSGETLDVNEGSGSGLDADMLDGISSGGFVRGDGVYNGRVNINATKDDFIVFDQTDSPLYFLWRDYSQGKLKLGSTNAVPTFRSNVDMNGYDVNAVRDLNSVRYVNFDQGGFIYDDAAGDVQFSDGIGAGGSLDMNQNNITNFVVDSRSSDPTSPVVGQMWYRSDLD